MKQFISKTIGFMLVLSIILTGIPAIQVQAASKPVISSSQVKIKKNSCSVKKGKKIKLAAKYGKKDVTKKGTWKSSKKNVATISKAGVLTAKKAGTTYITVKYKGQTSKKFKVVVKADTKPASGSDDTSGKGFTITYNKNSKNKSDKLNGPSKQKVSSSSGEILKFSTTVTPASGKKFLGWYDAPTGGNRIYETYKPSGDMTLYAHYTDENTQQIKFSLGCNYGYTENPSFMGEGEGFDYTNKREDSGPLQPFWNASVSDESAAERPVYYPKDRSWSHTYLVNDKKSVVIDSLPEPSIPGYEFKGWYTKDQTFTVVNGTLDGEKVEPGQEIDAGVTALYARFSKKLTISFDDLHGGVYNDIVIDTYGSVKDAGYKLPTLNVPGATFEGWSTSAGDTGVNTVKDETDWDNIIATYGAFCTTCLETATTKEELYLGMCKHGYDLSGHKNGAHRGTSINDMFMWEETDHITLYPVLKSHKVILGFDPKGGAFTQSVEENWYVTVYEEDTADFKKGIGYVEGFSGDTVYGGPAYFKGHEGESGWCSGNGKRTVPKVHRRNYIFDGWIMPDGTKLADDTLLTENVILSAKWIPGNCYVMFDPTDGTLTKEERDRVGLDGSWGYVVTTESTVSGSGKQLLVPVSSEGRKFEGWFTKDGEEVTKDTKITKDTTLYARWGTKTDNKPETQKPSTDKDNSANKDTDSNNKNETVHVTGMTMTDMEWKPVDKNNNHYTVEYGGKGKQAGLGFTANVLPATLKDSARNVIWTSSNPNIISVTAGKEVIYSPNWFDYFEFGSDAGDVVLTATSEDNPNVSFNINVTVIKK